MSLVTRFTCRLSFFFFTIRWGFHGGLKIDLEELGMDLSLKCLTLWAWIGGEKREQREL